MRKNVWVLPMRWGSFAIVYWWIRYKIETNLKYNPFLNAENVRPSKILHRITKVYVTGTMDESYVRQWLRIFEEEIIFGSLNGRFLFTFPIAQICSKWLSYLHYTQGIFDRRKLLKRLWPKKRTTALVGYLDSISLREKNWYQNISNV